MSNQSKAYLLTLLAVTFWGTSASAFKIALRYVEPYTLLFYSVLFSSLALFVILLLQGKGPLLLKLKKRQAGRLALLGLLNPFLYYTILFKAYSLLPGQIAMSINYGWPFALTLLSVPILKQKLSSVQMTAIIVSFAGALIIATKGSPAGFQDISKTGLLLAFLSTLIWASFWLVNAKDKTDPVIKLFWGFSFGLLYTILGSFLLGPVTVPVPKAFLPLAYIGFFEMGITFVLWLTALQLSSSAARIGNLIYIAPFLSLLFLRMVIGETIHPTTFIGLFIIVGSIYFQEKCAATMETNE
ncbi:MAG: DMT family transporter [Desulfocapsaceae bacterium]|jgi:drug/metabolite transporter (DMT)-like permease|nr:DMT family transporter [Desulfocapsaceae bacterium]